MPAAVCLAIAVVLVPSQTRIAVPPCGTTMPVPLVGLKVTVKSPVVALETNQKPLRSFVRTSTFADSVPESEYQETMNKAMALLRAVELAETQL